MRALLSPRATGTQSYIYVRDVSVLTQRCDWRHLSPTPRLDPSAVDARAAPVDMTTTGSHVLVVDDDPNVRNQISEYLGQHEFRVTAASSGKQMLEIIGREVIDLLLLETRLRSED